MSARRSLLLLAHRNPWPPTKGEKLRLHGLMRHLAERWDIWLGAGVDAAEDWPVRDAIAPLCAEAFHADLRGRSRPRSALRALAAGEPVTYAHFRDPALEAWVAERTGARPFDAVMAYSSGVAPALAAVRRPTRTVIDFVDVDSAKWTALAETAKGPMRAIYAREGRLMAAEERRLARMADASLVVTEAEADLFHRVTGVPATVVGNGVDLAYWAEGGHLPSPYPDDGRARIAFTGAMDYEPNVEAALRFAEAILPKLTGVEFVIAGGNPVRAVQALDARGDVRVTGRVEDMRPYLAHATLAVAPLRVARGVQNKVLEAMAAGTPMVASPEALSGIEAQGSVPAPATDDAFAAEIDRLLADPQARAALADRARDAVERGYAWRARAAELDAVLRGEAEGTEAA